MGFVAIEEMSEVFILRCDWRPGSLCPGVISTRYAVRGFEFGEELPDVPTLALLGLFEALTYALASVGTCGDVEEALIHHCVWCDGLRLTLDCEGYRPLGLLELFHE